MHSHKYTSCEVLPLVLEEYLKDFEIKKVELENNSLIRIADSKSCTRFMGCRVENIKVKPSPDFIKYRLESIGQKSINNIVDITNYVQFSFNKPMHAYDANLVSDFLEARFAKEVEENSEEYVALKLLGFIKEEI